MKKLIVLFQPYNILNCLLSIFFACFYGFIKIFAPYGILTPIFNPEYGPRFQQEKIIPFIKEDFSFLLVDAFPPFFFAIIITLIITVKNKNLRKNWSFFLLLFTFMMSLLGFITILIQQDII